MQRGSRCATTTPHCTSSCQGKVWKKYGLYCLDRTHLAPRHDSNRHTRYRGCQTRHCIRIWQHLRHEPVHCTGPLFVHMAQTNNLLLRTNLCGSKGFSQSAVAKRGKSEYSESVICSWSFLTFFKPHMSWQHSI